MKKLIISVLKFLRVREITQKMIYGRDCIFHCKSEVRLLFGSTKSDVVLGNRVIFKGILVSSCKGKIVMGDFSQLGLGSTIMSSNKVVVGNYTAIANDVVVCDNNNHPVNPHDRMVIRKTLPNSVERSWKYADSAPIIIGENCWIGQNSRICKGVTIGDGSIVAANSVVTKNVPANCIVAGNPAKIVKTDIDKLPRYFKE